MFPPCLKQASGAYPVFVSAAQGNQIFAAGAKTGFGGLNTNWLVAASKLLANTNEYLKGSHHYESLP